MSEISKKRFAFVGLGHRAGNFLAELAGRYAADAEIVGFCDLSRVRMETQARWLTERFGTPPVPCYPAEAFDRMVREQRPTTVIVTTIDGLHHTYIVRALELGCDVITEKPMTTDAEKCRTILAAVERHPERKVAVAFNYRWAPPNTKVRELLAADTIGPVRSVNLEWLLDVKHGADYFRRWHSEKNASGGLLVHKATHHFDLVNWWLDALPETVFAMGGLMFYGRENAVARGEEARTVYPRYTGEAAAVSDPFRLDLSSNERFKALYLEAEDETGYIRDRNVFRAGIDIEDNISVLVRYRGGALLTYTLNAFSSREGMRVVFNGDRGRLEYYLFEKSNPRKRENDEGFLSSAEKKSAGPRHATERAFIRVYPHFGAAYDVALTLGRGGHWGGDEPMWRNFFSANPPAEMFGRDAGPAAGAASILVGVAANQSLAQGATVRIDDLIPLAPEAKTLSQLSRR
jgi:Predicted dehydrogenases and related proteins